jgi:hypothetical protein
MVWIGSVWLRIGTRAQLMLLDMIILLVVILGEEQKL